MVLTLKRKYYKQKTTHHINKKHNYETASSIQETQ